MTLTVADATLVWCLASAVERLPESARAKHLAVKGRELSERMKREMEANANQTAL